MNPWLLFASLSGALAVLLGAFGAHGLRGRLTAEQLGSWNTAVEYHLLHSVVILALALYSARGGQGAALPTWLFATGVVLFSGSLYLLTTTGMRWMGPITPLGGLLLIGGWLSLLGLARS